MIHAGRSGSGGRRQDTLVVVLRDDDLACLQACRPTVLSQHILAFDLDVHLELRDQGIQHVTPWSFLEADDRPACAAVEAELWAFWQQAAALPCAACDLFRLAAFRHRGWIARAAWIAFVLDRVLRTLKPECVVVFEEPAGHGLRPAAACPQLPLLNMLLRGMAPQYGCEVDVISAAEQRRGGRAGFRDVVAEHGQETGEPAERRLPRERNLVLFVASGPDIVRQLPLIEAMSAATDLVPVQVCKTAEAPAVARARAAGHLFFHESQLLPAPGSIAVPDLAVARTSFERLCRRTTGWCATVFGNEHCRPHFDFLFGPYAAAMAGHVQRWTRFLEDYRPVAVVANSPAALPDIAAGLGVPVLLLPHGLVQAGVPQLAACAAGCHVGVRGPDQRQRVAAAGVSPERIVVAGDPQVDVIRNAARRIELDATTRSRVRHRLGVQPEERCIALLGGSLGCLALRDSLPRTDWRAAVDCFDELAELTRRRPAWRWVLKAHPRYDHPRLYQPAGRRRVPPARLLVAADCQLLDVVAAADAVVVFNVPTSAMVEAAFLPRPIYLLAPALTWYDQHEEGLADWLHIPSVAALEAELATIFANEDACARRVAESRAALESYLDETAAAPANTARVLHALAGLIDAAALPTVAAT